VDSREGTSCTSRYAHDCSTTQTQISGHTDGRLKLFLHRETLELIGVPIFGEDAAELLHIGQAVFLLKGKITYFVNTVLTIRPSWNVTKLRPSMA